MIRIRSKQEGFHRCGVQHAANWVEHPDGKFSAEELETLKNEPMLQVQTGEDAEDSGGSSGLTCKKLTAILTRMGVDVPKPPVKKVELETLLDKVLSEPMPAKGKGFTDKSGEDGQKVESPNPGTVGDGGEG